MLVADLVIEWPDIPNWLKRSARVDLALLLVGVRPAIRTEIVGPVKSEIIRRWARSFGWFVAFDDDQYIAISPVSGLPHRVLAIDREQAPHALRLGLALGYPPCCCRAAHRIGEQNLDQWSATIVKRGFIGRFKLIDPSGYSKGISLISHIPCSPYCVASLEQVNELLCGWGYSPRRRRRNRAKNQPPIT